MLGKSKIVAHFVKVFPLNCWLPACFVKAHGFEKIQSWAPRFDFRAYSNRELNTPSCESDEGGLQVTISVKHARLRGKTIAHANIFTQSAVQKEAHAKRQLANRNHQKSSDQQDPQSS